MQEHLKNGYFQYAYDQHSGAPVVVIPAGLAFEKIYDDLVAAGDNPLDASSLFWQLYGGDGSHPALAGTYLTACTIFGALTNNRYPSAHGHRMVFQMRRVMLCSGQPILQCLKTRRVKTLLRFFFHLAEPDLNLNLTRT